MGNSGWHVAYHGTGQGSVGDILLSTLRQGPRALQGPGIYITPSIVYASLYATSLTLRDGSRAKAVLQCRVRPSAISARRPATQGVPSNGGRIDKNFDNNQLNWLVRPSGSSGLASPDQLVCYGILVKK